MSYSQVVSRGAGPTYSATPGTHPLIPENVSASIIKATIQKSAVRQLFKTRNMTTAQQRMPVLATKPVGYFVTGDTGLKQTTSLSWSNKFLDAEELAVIVPIPEKLLDDVQYDLWGEIKPELGRGARRGPGRGCPVRLQQAGVVAREHRGRSDCCRQHGDPDGPVRDP
jgi:HK97 family phage major capsid protein